MSRRKEIQMKKNMKKLAIFMMIAAIAVFAAATTASAWWMNGIWGEYEVIGTGQCLFSLAGFDKTSLAPLPTCVPPTCDPAKFVTSIGTTFYDGVYKFDHTGTGSATLTGRQVSAAGASVSTLKFDFTYTLDHGAITFATIPGTDTSTCDTGVCGPGNVTRLSTGPQHGNISPFQDSLEIHCGAPVIIDILKADLTPAGPQLICNISLAGSRK
jgi:hypothetical protein